MAVRRSFDSEPSDAEEKAPAMYDIHVFCCIHKRPDGHTRGSCGAKGSQRLSDAMCRRAMATGLARIRINHAGCLNLCEHGPVVVIYPQGTWYHYETETDVDEILTQHVRRGKIVERLLLDPAIVRPRH